jgi:hypothetical protein
MSLPPLLVTAHTRSPRILNYKVVSLFCKIG